MLSAVTDWVSPTALSTRLEQGTMSVRTPEHLLAALAGLGIDNCTIELDRAELPILDGSAAPYVRAIQQTGIVAQPEPLSQVVVTEPLTVWDADRFVAAFPDTLFRVSYGIDFPGTAIGQQWTSWVVTPELIARELAPARTFTTRAQVDGLKARGLIQGGSLDCALVADTTGWVGQLPYWPDEPSRHKVLDLVGDLALVGAPIIAHIVAYKAGHDLHVRLAHLLRQRLQSQP